MPDTISPSVVSASMIGRVVTVVFSEPMDPATLIIKENYSIDGMVILRADLVPKSNNTKTALVVTGFLPSTVYTVFVSGVTDVAGNLLEGASRIVRPTGIASAEAFGTPEVIGMATYADTVLEDDPEVYFKLDESSGIAAADSSGNGHSGTYIGGPTLGVSGPFAGAVGVSFDGTNDRLEFDTPFSPTISKFTAELWFKWDSTVSTALSTFLSWEGNGGSGGGIALGLGTSPGGNAGTGLIWAGWSEPFIAELKVTNAAAPAPYNDDQWHHLVVVWDGTSGIEYDASQVTIYVDKVAVSQSEASFGDKTGATPYTTNRAMIAGTNAAGWDNFTKVEMAHMALYVNKALTLDRIEAHYDASGL